MALTTLSRKQLRITVSGTSEHTIDFDSVMIQGDKYGTAYITMISGTAVQFDSSGNAIDSDSITLSATGNATKEILEITRGVPIRYKGGAGSEVFQINIASN